MSIPKELKIQYEYYFSLIAQFEEEMSKTKPSKSYYTIDYRMQILPSVQKLEKSSPKIIPYLSEYLQKSYEGLAVPPTIATAWTTLFSFLASAKELENTPGPSGNLNAWITWGSEF